VKYAHVIAACFIFFFLQMVLAPRIAFGEIAPDFPLLLVAYFSLNRGAFQGSISGFFVGLLQDLYSPELLGLNALTKSLAGYVLGLVGGKAEPDNLPFLVGLFGIAALANDFVYLLFFTGLDLGRFFVMFFTIAVPSAVYTAILGVVVHKVATYFGGKVVKTFGKARS
jgi:rod shape-determining protein MreD